MRVRTITEASASVAATRPAPPMAEVRRLLSRYRRDALRTQRSAATAPVPHARDRRR